MESSPLLNVPLHVISDILIQLDSIQDLGCAILSHRIFLAAYRENAHTIPNGVIRNQISDELFPFAVALLDSTEIDPRDSGAVLCLLERLGHHILQPEKVIATLPHLTLDSHVFMSKNYEAAEFMSYDLAKEAAAALQGNVGIFHSPDITPSEKFRLVRAFFRYQMMCNLICVRYGNPMEPEERYRHLIDPFSPWVNHQVLCVISYLERKIHHAFDEVAAHDVEWGSNKVDWTKTKPERAQEFLSHGLPFLKKVACAKTYREKCSLLQLDSFDHIDPENYPCRLTYAMAPEETFLLPLELDDTDIPLQDYEPAHIRRLDRVLNGQYDTINSGPFRSWFAGYQHIPIYYSTYGSHEQNFLEGGYVIWDHLDMPDSGLQAEWLRGRPFYERSHEWPESEVMLSMARRSDIFAEGGSGHWPRHGSDFSRITGLTEQDKQKLIKKWRNETCRAIVENFENWKIRVPDFPTWS